MPLEPPLAGLMKDTDFASSTAFLKASTVEMSGFGAPSFTITPTPTRARLVRLNGATLLLAASSSIAAGLSTMTSKVSPPSTRLTRPPTVSLSMIELVSARLLVFRGQRHHGRLEGAGGEHLEVRRMRDGDGRAERAGATNIAQATVDRVFLMGSSGVPQRASRLTPQVFPISTVPMQPIHVIGGGLAGSRGRLADRLPRRARRAARDAARARHRSATRPTASPSSSARTRSAPTTASTTRSGSCTRRCGGSAR